MSEECTEPDRKACPRMCEEFCNKAEEAKSELPSSTGSAEDRGMAMMAVPMKDLPPLALEFAKHLCRELGMCGEVLLTATGSDAVVNYVEDPATCWLKGEPDEEGWYWMDYQMHTDIFPAFWDGDHWQNSAGTTLNVAQFDAEWQGPIAPIGRTINKHQNDKAQRPGD